MVSADVWDSAADEGAEAEGGEMRPMNYRYLDIPDCCFVCKFGERYYGRIRCNLDGDIFHFSDDGMSIDVYGICDSFEKGAK